MRVSRQQAEEHRKRIVDAASRLFREGGISATGVDAVMHAAGFTHGGFYGHFESKDKLAAEACRQSTAQALERWEAFAGRENPLAALIAHYLSADHRDNPGEGCLVAALGAEAARGSPEVRGAVTDGIRSFLAALERTVPGTGRKAKRAHAVTTLTALVGAMVVARAVDDPALSKEILAAAAKSLAAANPAAKVP